MWNRERGTAGFSPCGAESLTWLSPPSAESVFRLLPEDGDLARLSQMSCCKKPANIREESLTQGGRALETVFLKK